MIRILTWGVAWAISGALWSTVGGMMEGWDGADVPFAIIGSAFAFSLAGFLSASDNGRGRVMVGLAWGLAIPTGLGASVVLARAVTGFDLELGYMIPWVGEGAVSGLLGGIAEHRWARPGDVTVILFVASFAVAAVVFVLASYVFAVAYGQIDLDILPLWLPILLGGFVAGVVARVCPEWYQSRSRSPIG